EMENLDISTIRNEIDAERDYVVSLRRFFHENPELPRKEFGTAKRIEEELSSFGLETTRVGETGVYAVLEGNGEGKTIILRADIDALPVEETNSCPYRSRTKGVMHACGHDAHTAALLLAAKILSRHRNLFPGRVKFCFQQAEEIGYGARVFIDNGFVEGDRTFGIHLASNIPVGKVGVTKGPNNASVDYFKITVSGRGAHVSTPEKGVDALYIASQIVVGAQGLVTRRTNPTDSVIIGIGRLDAGRAYNVVAKEAVLEGTIRTMYPSIREKVKKELETLALSTASIYGGSASIEYKDFTSPLVNPEGSTKEVEKVALSLFGHDNVITNRPYSLGGDDFAEFINKVEGTYAYVGSGNENNPNTLVAHHDGLFDIDEDCLLVSAELHVLYAMEYLRDFREV
ncbi:MAG: M20 family metallopeptidase, partial [Candidatus Ornithospirochaeta sp.]